MKIIDLINAGYITPGAKILRKTRTAIFIGYIQNDGSIKLEDNSIHKTPSGAAKSTNNGKNIDGWLTWRLFEQQNLTLNDIRNQNIGA